MRYMASAAGGSTSAGPAQSAPRTARGLDNRHKSKLMEINTLERTQEVVFCLLISAATCNLR